MVKLNLESNEPKPAVKKKNRALKIGLGVGALVLVPVIGMTFAASITINSSNAIQFGQGYQAATACDNNLTITPTSSFQTNSSTFKLATVAISDFDTQACASKKITLKVLNSSGTEQVIAAGTGAETKRVVFTLPASGTSVTLPDPSEDYTVTSSAFGASATVTITLTTVLAATSVDGFTIESTN